MRDRPSQGLTLGLKYKVQKRLKNMEVVERKQVGDVESLVNRTSRGSHIGSYAGKESEL